MVALVLLFLLTQQLPVVLLVALLVLCYLTAIELRNEDEPLLIKANVLGYAAFRIWLAARRRRRSA